MEMKCNIFHEGLRWSNTEDMFCSFLGLKSNVWLSMYRNIEFFSRRWGLSVTVGKTHFFFILISNLPFCCSGCRSLFNTLDFIQYEIKLQPDHMQQVGSVGQSIRLKNLLTICPGLTLIIEIFFITKWQISGVNKPVK